MSSIPELKPCPFCGKRDFTVHSSRRVVTHNFTGCILAGHSFSLDTWYLRPVEDAQADEIKKLHAELKEASIDAGRSLSVNADLRAEVGQANAEILRMAHEYKMLVKQDQTNIRIGGKAAKEVFDLRAERDILKAQVTELLESLEDMVWQYCRNDDETVSHNFMSAGESAFDILETAGMLTNVGLEKYAKVRETTP